MNDCELISRVYDLGEGRILGVDQSGDERDKTALCFAMHTNGNIVVLDTKIIEQQKDIDEYINMNMKEIYGVFQVNKVLQ